MLALTSSCVLSVFPLLVTNIFNPLFRRVGCFCLSLERQRDKNRYRWTRGKRSVAKVAGRERRRGECQNAIGFYFGAKAALRPRDRPSRGRTAPTGAEQSENKTRSQPLWVR